MTMIDAGWDLRSRITSDAMERQEENSERIESLRRQQSQAPTPKQVKHEMNDANKDVLIETLKRKIKVLENENKELREEMKKAYAQIYEKF
jgi:myo-inositol-1-phosphate synthase